MKLLRLDIIFFTLDIAFGKEMGCLNTNTFRRQDDRKTEKNIGSTMHHTSFAFFKCIFILKITKFAF